MRKGGHDEPTGSRWSMNVYEALAQPVRRRIVELLASGEVRSGHVAAAICQEFSVTPSAVSHHLRILAASGWVQVRRDENFRLYRLDESAIKQIESEGRRLRRIWRRRIGELHKNEPQLWHVRPIEGSQRGMRGSPGRSDPWLQDH